MSEQEFDPVAQMGHDGAEIKRLRARVAELEKALVAALENGHHGMDCSKRGDGGSIENGCDCWRLFAHLALGKR